MTSRSVLCAGVAIAATVAATSAAAQSSAKRPSAGTLLEELIVTAEKREQNLQDVPVAITAFTAKQRETTGISTIQDITNFTPGLTYSSNLDRAAIRGVGRLTNRLSSEAAVATYSDGFYTTSVAEVGKSTLAVERVEVLRGPQGTLYGRNAIGGAINVISRHPTRAPYGEARVTLGNYGFQSYEIAASGPVSDKVRVRGYGNYVKQNDGYFTNLAFGKRPTDALDRHYVEFQVEADLAENVDLWVKYANSRWVDESGNSGGALSNRNFDKNLIGVDALNFNAAYGLQSVDPLRNLAIPRTQVGTVTNNPQLISPRTFISNFQNGTRINLDDAHILDVHLTARFDGFSIKYVGGYDSYVYDQLSDGDSTDVLSYTIPLNASPLPAQNTCQYVPGCQPLTINPAGNIFSYIEDNRWTSHEINISSSGNGPLQWLGGLYYFKEWYHNPQVSSSVNQRGIYSPTGAPVGNPLGSAANPKGELYHFDYDMTTRSMAAYGQVDWKIVPEVQLTLGLRYTADKKQGHEDFRALCYTIACIGDPRVFGNLVGNTVLDITTLLAASYPTATAAAVDGVVTPVRQVGPTSFVNYVIDPATGQARRQLRNTWHGWTGTAGVEWNPDRSTNAYFRFGRGYKSGGYNAGEIVPVPSTEPEFVDAYEIGLKKEFGASLRVNTAIFYYDYSDLQIPIRVANTTSLGTVLQTRFLNVPKSVSKGFELEASWTPVQRLSLLLSYSYNDTSVKTACTVADQRACVLDTADPRAQEPTAKPVLTATTGEVLQSIKGNSLPYAPKSKVALNINYTFLLDGSTLTLGGNYVWRDEAYANLFTREYNRAPSWDSADVRAVWRTNDGRYTVIGYVRNVFDALTYPAAGGGTRLSPDPATPTRLNNVVKSLGLNPPRTFGVSIYYKFM